MAYQSVIEILQNIIKYILQYCIYIYIYYCFCCRVFDTKEEEKKPASFVGLILNNLLHETGMAFLKGIVLIIFTLTQSY